MVPQDERLLGSRARTLIMLASRYFDKYNANIAPWKDSIEEYLVQQARSSGDGLKNPGLIQNALLWPVRKAPPLDRKVAQHITSNEETVDAVRSFVSQLIRGNEFSELAGYVGEIPEPVWPSEDLFPGPYDEPGEQQFVEPQSTRLKPAVKAMGIAAAVVVVLLLSWMFWPRTITTTTTMATTTQPGSKAKTEVTTTRTTSPVPDDAPLRKVADGVQQAANSSSVSSAALRSIQQSMDVQSKASREQNGLLREQNTLLKDQNRLLQQIAAKNPTVNVVNQAPTRRSRPAAVKKTPARTAPASRPNRRSVSDQGGLPINPKQEVAYIDSTAKGGPRVKVVSSKVRKP